MSLAKPLHEKTNFSSFFFHFPFFFFYIYIPIFMIGKNIGRAAPVPTPMLWLLGHLSFCLATPLILTTQLDTALTLLHSKRPKLHTSIGSVKLGQLLG